MTTLGGIAGALVPSSASFAAAAVAAAYSLWWHAHKAWTFPGSRSGWQTDRRIATRTRFGRLYFGALLGFGIATYMTTPLVYTLALYAAAIHLPVAVLAGVGFGLGRSRPIITGLRARGKLGAPDVADRFLYLTASDRLVGCLISVVLIVSLVL